MKGIVYSLLLLCCLLNPCKSMALNVNELRESVPAYWLHHYKSQQQEVSIRAPIFIPQVDCLPILKVRLYQLDPEEENLQQLQQYFDYSEPYGFNYSNDPVVSGRIGRPYKSSVFENIWQTEGDVDFKNVFAANQCDSLERVIEDYRIAFNNMLENTQITAIPNMAWIETPYLNVEPGTYEYGEPAQFGNLTGVGGYSVQYWPAIRNIPVVMGHGYAYEGTYKTAVQRRIGSASELNVYSHYSENLWSLGSLVLWRETGVYSEDYTSLCSFQEIEETLKKLVESGKVKDVFSIVLGYVVYADPVVEYKDDDDTVSTQDFVAIPTWIVEAIYTENPNRNYSEFPESGDPTVYTYSRHVAYMKLNISAQTGKLYDPSDTANDRVYSKDDWME